MVFDLGVVCVSGNDSIGNLQLSAVEKALEDNRGRGSMGNSRRSRTIGATPRD